MKKTFIFLLTIIILFTYRFSYGEAFEIVGESAILIDFDTLEILYEKNPHQAMYPASTTKIMTGILAIELGNLTDMVKIDQEIVGLTDGSHIALDVGEEMPLNDMVHALLVESANDAACAIAKHIGGSIDEFINMMNEKAKSLGALNTNFTNPSGLPDENHVTSAYDLALIARYAMENETFRSIVNKHTYTIQPTNLKEERHLWSSNRLLYSNDKVDVGGKLVPIKYEGVNGVKTGYTIAANQCLVASYEDEDNKLISVVLKSEGKNIYSDTQLLFNYGKSSFENRQVGFKGKFVQNFKVENGKSEYVAGITESDFYHLMSKLETKAIEGKIVIEGNLEAPISKDQVIGVYEYYQNNKLLGKTNIIATMEVEAIKPPSTFSKIISKWYLFVFLFLIVSRLAYLYRRHKVRKKRRKSAAYSQ